MQKVRTQRGITLIALIITIIVMLILVGVTVSISLNGGLFTTAKEATNKTQVEIDKEQLLELALGAIGRDGKVDYDELIESVEGKFTVTGEGEDATYTSKSGNEFVVNEWGGVAKAPVYELSGKWRFSYNPTPKVADTEGIYLNQRITFTSPGDALEWDSEYNPIVFENASYSTIRLVYEDMFQDGICYLCVYFDESLAYNPSLGSWVGNNGMGINDYNLVDFGSTPQPVSQEFYDWFTANANPFEPLKLSGKWQFTNSPQPETSDVWGVYLTEDVTFTSQGYVNINDEDVDLSEYTFNNITVAHDLSPFDDDVHYITIYYNDNKVYEWNDSWRFNGELCDTNIVNFSSEQEVSQGFYDWFTANATQIGE